MFWPLNSTESWKDVQVNEDLDEEKKREVWYLIREYSSVFTDCPGKTDLVECHIDVIDDTPVRQRPYPLHNTKKKVFRWVRHASIATR